MEQKRVIIIIPCTKLNAYVLECLARCLRLAYDNFGVVLLPDEPVELPLEVRSPSITVVPTGAVTIAAKRNIAVRVFPGADYYACIDSDAYPDEQWLREGVAAFTNESIWAVGGPSLTPKEEGLRQRVVGNATRSFLVSGDLAFSKKRSASRYCRSLHSCNLILSASALEHAGGFPEGLRTGEDRVLCHRIRRLGGKIYYHSGAIVYHHNRHLGMPFFLQRLIHGNSIFSIMREDSDPHNLLLPMPLVVILLAALAIYAEFLWQGGWTVAATLGVGYLCLIVAEAVRTSNRLQEVPLTVPAFVLANSGYVLGVLLRLAGMRLDVRSLYRNCRETRRRGIKNHESN